MAKLSNGFLSIADLYPDLTPDQRQVAQENIDRYLQLILRIQKRLENDPQALAAAEAIVDAEETDD